VEDELLTVMLYYVTKFSATVSCSDLLVVIFEHFIKENTDSCTRH